MLALRFRPALLDALKSYRREYFSADLGAGLTVAFVALPLAMAFAIASGATPAQGLITAIIGGFLVAALGGTRMQVAGPAGAFVALLYSIVERHGMPGLQVATACAGVLLFALGALRLGAMVRFVPVSIVTGFTNGIAVIIAVQQMKDLFGLQISKMPSNFFMQIEALARAASSFNWRAVLVAAVALSFVLLWPKSYSARGRGLLRTLARVPAPLVALIAGALVAAALGNGVETIGSRFGELPRELAKFTPPRLDWDSARNLVGPTLAIALLGAIESLLCARVADDLAGTRHDPNQELMAQGVANLVSPLFGGIAVTGTVARTVTNIRSGAKSPLASMIHALVLLAIVLLFAPLAARIPMAALAAVLLNVAYKMVDWNSFARLRNFSINYRIIMLSSFALTVIFDLTVAVEVGLVLASLFFITRISSLTRVHRIRLPADLSVSADGRPIAAYRIFGSLFFGSISKLDELFELSDTDASIIVLSMHQLINIDTTGLDKLEALHRQCCSRGGGLFIAEANDQPLSLLRRSGLADRMGEHHVFDTFRDALAAARGVPDTEPITLTG